MNYMYILTTAILFFLLSPGVLISLPPGSSHTVQLATHAIVFAVVHKYVQHGLLKQR
jgi:quercetin dioxygenase-like cupin family protein